MLQSSARPARSCRYAASMYLHRSIRVQRVMLGRQVPQSIAQSLGTRIVFRNSYVDEHSPVLQNIDPLFQNAGEHIPLQARRAFRNMQQYIVVEGVYTGVDQAGAALSGSTGEAGRHTARIRSHRPIPPYIVNRVNRDARNTAV